MLQIRTLINVYAVSHETSTTTLVFSVIVMLLVVNAFFGLSDCFHHNNSLSLTSRVYFASACNSIVHELKIRIAKIYFTCISGEK